MADSFEESFMYLNLCFTKSYFSLLPKIYSFDDLLRMITELVQYFLCSLQISFLLLKLLLMGLHLPIWQLENPSHFEMTWVFLQLFLSQLFICCYFSWLLHLFILSYCSHYEFHLHFLLHFDLTGHQIIKSLLMQHY